MIDGGNGMFHYIFKDFQYMLKSEKLLLIIIVCIQLISILVVFFSYGVINHYNTKVGVMEDKALTYSFDITNDDRPLTGEEINGFYNVLFSVIDNKIDRVFAMGRNDTTFKILFNAGYDYENKKLVVHQKNIENVFLMYLDDESTRFDNETEEIIKRFEAGEKVALVGIDKLPEEDVIEIAGEKYNIIGSFKEGPYINAIEIFFTEIPNDIEVVHTSVFFSKPLLEPEYEIFASTAKMYFGDRVNIPEFNGINNENEYRVYRNIMAILGAFIIMCGVNCCIIYSHMLEKRRRRFAISRVCGCNTLKAVFIYLFELLSISLVTLIVGVVLFIKVIKPKAELMFEYMEYYFSVEVYTRITLLYFVILLFIYFVLVCRYVKKTPIALSKEA